MAALRKKWLFAAVLALSPAGVNVYAQSLSYHVAATDMRWAYEVEEVGTSATIRVSVEDYDVVAVDSGFLLSVGGPCAWPRAGEPRLPILPVVFNLPAKADYTISVVPGDYREAVVTNLLPEAAMRSVSVSDEVSRVEVSRQSDPLIYQLDAFWPVSFYSVHEAMGGEKRYLRIGMNIFQYNPVTHRLRFYPDLSLRLDLIHATSGGPDA